MRKIVVYIAMSLDGYIADKEGRVNWLSGDHTEADNMGSYEMFIDTVDTVVMGYKTYHQIVTELSPTEWPYKNQQTYVMTHRKFKDNNHIIFTNETIANLCKQWNGVNGKNIWLCGGANLIRQFHEKELVDKYYITVIPTILGGGTRLFDNSVRETKLQLLYTKQYNGIVDLVYEKRREE